MHREGRAHGARRFGQRELNTYYLTILVVRIVTSSWMVWELTMDIRQGRLATRLLRPLPAPLRRRGYVRLIRARLRRAGVATGSP